MALLEINATEQQDIKDKISKEPDWYVAQYKNIWYAIQRQHVNGYFCGYIGLPCSIDLPILGKYDEHGHEIIEKLPVLKEIRMDGSYKVSPLKKIIYIGMDCLMMNLMGIIIIGLDKNYLKHIIQMDILILLNQLIL